MTPTFMDPNKTISHFGENNLINIIEQIISQKTGKKLILDDSFFFSLRDFYEYDQLVLNSDMLVASTDVPEQMSYFQIGRKAVIMNLSDLIVKGVEPRAIIISLGLPIDLNITNFKDIIEGILDVCYKWGIDYIGGDINQSKELIINPTIFGFQNRNDIIFRSGIHSGDIIVANGKFGLTGVGFDILIKKKGNIQDYPKYEESIKSVLEPDDSTTEAHFLAGNHIATASIDSSDGLGKSLSDLMVVNPEYGFEIDFNSDLISFQALEYSKEFKVNLEELVFNGGEEFIHLFTLPSNKLDIARNLVNSMGGTLFKIGRVISDKEIYLMKNGKRIKLYSFGYEHFK